MIQKVPLEKLAMSCHQEKSHRNLLVPLLVQLGQKENQAFLDNLDLLDLLEKEGHQEELVSLENQV